MLQTPSTYSLVSASAEGETPLTAFDKALLLAGVGNCNLLKVSSILPPYCEFTNGLTIPEGSLLPIAYASVISNVPGKLICAGVAVGIGKDAESYGVVMEYHGYESRDKTSDLLYKMVEEAFNIRNRKLSEVKIIAVEHIVVNCGCVFAAIPLWYK
jgi:arginine decarboxylase